MTLRGLAFIFSIAASNSLLADSIDLNLHGEAFRITYAKAVAKKTVVDLGALLLKERYQQEDEALFHAGLNFVFDSLRFGVRAIYTTPGDTDLVSLGFGGQGRFSLARRVGIGGLFYYAPAATSGGDSKGYHEAAVRFDFMMARGAYCYVGYRNLKVKIYSEENKVELDDDFHVGLKFFF